MRDVSFDVLLARGAGPPTPIRPQSLEKYLHGPMKAKNLTDEIIDQRAAELAKAHHESQKVRRPLPPQRASPPARATFPPSFET